MISFIFLGPLLSNVFNKPVEKEWIKKLWSVLMLKSRIDVRPLPKKVVKKIFAGLSKGLFSLYSNHRLKMEMAMNFTKEISHRSCSIMSEFFFVQWQF